MCDAEHLRASAMRMLAMRDHGREELRCKLLERNPSAEDEVDALLDEFERNDWLDDSRYANRYLEARRDKGFGPLRIKAELRQRGIDAILIQQVMEECVDWPERLSVAAERKFGSAKATDRREQGRRARFLEGRGFPSDLVRDYLWRDEF